MALRNARPRHAAAEHIVQKLVLPLDHPVDAVIPFLDAVAELLVKRALKNGRLRRLALQLKPTVTSE